MMGLVPFEVERAEGPLSLCPPCEDMVRGWASASPKESSHVGTLTLDFQTLEL